MPRAASIASGGARNASPNQPRGNRQFRHRRSHFPNPARPSQASTVVKATRPGPKPQSVMRASLRPSAAGSASVYIQASPHERLKVSATKVRRAGIWLDARCALSKCPVSQSVAFNVVLSEAAGPVIAYAPPVWLSVRTQSRCRAVAPLSPQERLRPWSIPDPRRSKTSPARPVRSSPVLRRMPAIRAQRIGVKSACQAKLRNVAVEGNGTVSQVRAPAIPLVYVRKAAGSHQSTP